jgi:hypothetical protein
MESPLYLLLDKDEMSNLYRGHSIDASYHLAKRFQRFLEIDKSETRIACGGQYGCHRQVLFLIGQFPKQLFL